MPALRSALATICLILSLTPAQARKIANGGEIPAADARGEFEQGPAPRPGDRVCGMSPAGELLAILEFRPDRKLHPLRVLGTL